MLSGSGDPAPPRPNVLLISIDTLRADGLGVYGSPRELAGRYGSRSIPGALVPSKELEQLAYGGAVQ